jgi:TetR/AcrR family acrAB operon transcriptional repressor
MNAASRQAKLKLPISASMAAQGLHALIDGLIQNWLLDPQAFDLLEVGQCVMNVYLRGMGFASELDPTIKAERIPPAV